MGAIPGRSQAAAAEQCKASTGQDDPACVNLRHFLSCPSASFVDYDYFFCPVCERIWEKSFFYQDYWPHWTVIPFASFKEKRERWVQVTGVDEYPEQAFSGTVNELSAWVMKLEIPVVVQGV